VPCRSSGSREGERCLASAVALGCEDLLTRVRDLLLCLAAGPRAASRPRPSNLAWAVQGAPGPSGAEKRYTRPQCMFRNTSCCSVVPFSSIPLQPGSLAPPRDAVTSRGGAGPVHACESKARLRTPSQELIARAGRGHGRAEVIIAQTTFPPSALRYAPQSALRASMIIRPRPPSSPGPASCRTGIASLASQT
jgi:hypothetical protein